MDLCPAREVAILGVSSECQDSVMAILFWLEDAAKPFKWRTSFRTGQQLISASAEEQVWKEAERAWV